MRILSIGTTKYTTVTAVDEPSRGGACHNYEIVSKREHPEFKKPCFRDVLSFQKGPIKECGLNGIQDEDLIVIIMDRLKGFQSGKYACEENSEAYVLLGNALAALRKRTDVREQRGVEGTHEI
ncbi:hypothetical protein LCGC14_0844550 [marine sediment metagenome]|uniref:Acb2/Tad1 hairpin domain-containing protein n=1 Tax=marine sediment metagenome TaxID=412755 RepID=A0A0F9RWS4_9ZZZZ